MTHNGETQQELDCSGAYEMSAGQKLTGRITWMQREVVDIH
jgi:hypothetical protein